MNKEIKTISKTVIVVCLCIISYKIGKDSQIKKDITPIIKKYDQCICVSCGEPLDYDEIYLLVNNYDETNNNTNTN